MIQVYVHFQHFNITLARLVYHIAGFRVGLPSIAGEFAKLKFLLVARRAVRYGVEGLLFRYFTFALTTR